MALKMRKQKDISGQPKGKGKVHIEETYGIDKPSDFTLLTGHVWYHLLMNGSNINDTKSALLSFFTKESSVPDNMAMYNYVIKMDKQYKKMQKRFSVDSQFSAFKEVNKLE